MLWSHLSFFSILLNLSFMVSSGVALPIRCEYPCQQPPPSQPIYGTPPPPSPSPPSEPVYESPPPPPPSPSGPIYDPYTPPTKPSCAPPPPPAPLSPTGPSYGVPPLLLPGNCQPSMQNCAYPPPIANVYQPVGSASHLPINCLLVLVLMLLSFLYF
ncbi:hypothetical protein HanXRQr2_Chr08g0350491 [Helianthus annuus]|uniref:Uncharacterized protein n=1 Tax=Helianthus annuus TaxID=4232 RepID=A0A9K3NDF5_HELAN|nr:hypothetical protein HanXRQr2_Chr08g0350491 [Helianthus annuus]KAJ0902576.1 hypothetical protein HanPSC8_Chr08g0338641 [Helianthus annuus]